MQRITNAGEVASAVERWHQTFAYGATRQKHGKSERYEHRELGIWGYFEIKRKPHGDEYYYHVFGTLEPEFCQVVEINPPRQGNQGNLQGILAKDVNGARWILHRGQMTTRERIILPKHLARQADLESVEIAAHRKPIDAFVVANLDAQVDSVPYQFSTFLKRYKSVRELTAMDAAAL